MQNFLSKTYEDSQVFKVLDLTQFSLIHRKEWLYVDSTAFMLLHIFAYKKFLFPLLL